MNHYESFDPGRIPWFRKALSSGICIVADASRWERLLVALHELITGQLINADTVLSNKMDLVTPDTLKTVKRQIQDMGRVPKVGPGFLNARKTPMGGFDIWGRREAALYSGPAHTAHRMTRRSKQKHAESPRNMIPTEETSTGNNTLLSGLCSVQAAHSPFPVCRVLFLSRTAYDVNNIYCGGLPC